MSQVTSNIFLNISTSHTSKPMRFFSILRRGANPRVDAHGVADTSVSGIAIGWNRGVKPEVAPSTANEAIVYLPSIAPVQQERDIATLLCRALDTCTKPNSRFNCEESDHLITYRNGDREWYSKKFTISKIENKATEADLLMYEYAYPIADVYWFDCQERTQGNWWQTDFIKSVQLMTNCIYFLFNTSGLVLSILRLLLCCRNSKHTGHLLQMLLFAFFGFLTFVGYFLLMIWAFAASIIDIAGSTLTEQSITKAFAIVTFAASVVLPTRLTDKFHDAIMLFNSFMFYFTPCGERKRGALNDQIRELLKRIQNLDDGNENTNYPYERIHLIGKGFGACLAIDALFPNKGQPDARVFGRIQHLVTLGCQFDMVRTLQPSYYARGRYRERNDIRWTSIFNPEDFFTSIFWNDSAREGSAATMGVDSAVYPDRNEAFSIWRGPECCCLAQGIIAHKQYFENACDPGMICARIIKAIFANPLNDKHWLAYEWDEDTAGGGEDVANAEEGKCSSAGSTHTRDEVTAGGGEDLASVEEGTYSSAGSTHTRRALCDDGYDTPRSPSRSHALQSS